MPIAFSALACILVSARFDEYVEIGVRSVSFCGKRVFVRSRCARRNLEVVSRAGFKPCKDRFVEEDGSALGCLRFRIGSAFIFAVIDNAVQAVCTPPVNLCATIIYLTDGDSLDGRACRSHGKRVPVTMVIVCSEVPLGVHAFEEEVIRCAWSEAGQCDGSALGCFFLLY